MYAADNPAIQRLLDAAWRDEHTLQFALTSEVYGTHVQQAVEKLFKALISAHGEEFKFTHDLEELVLRLVTLGETPAPMAMSFKDLTDYGVQMRYDSGAKLDDLVREALRRQVAELRLYVMKRLAELKAAGVLVKNP
jgi:HEPN domain-containing protein